jgi:hypothetical protein
MQKVEGSSPFIRSRGTVCAQRGVNRALKDVTLEERLHVAMARQ